MIVKNKELRLTEVFFFQYKEKEDIKVYLQYF